MNVVGGEEEKDGREEEGQGSDRSHMTSVHLLTIPTFPPIYVVFQNKLSWSIFYSSSKLLEYDTVLSPTLRSVTHCRRAFKYLESKFILRTMNIL